jgi:hypothetical protein
MEHLSVNFSTWNQVDVRRFDKSHNWIARLQGQFLASLFGQQRRERKSAIQFNPHQRAVAGDGLDNG